jgi:tetratricopeptide (TPR) repeat protein
MQMQEDSLELLISIGHLARVYRRFDDARYLFERLALIYPQRAFPYLGLGLVEVDRANYRGAARLFASALEVVPDNALACAWLGTTQVLDGHYALGARTLMKVVGSDEPSASSMAMAFLKLPECAPFINANANSALAAGAAPPAHAAAPLSTIERLTIRGRY